MSFFVYILRCSDGSYYTGHTDNLEIRLLKHREGTYDGYTARRLPVSPVFLDEFTTRDEAFARERQIKGWSRRKKEGLINGEWNKLVDYSRGKRDDF